MVTSGAGGSDRVCHRRLHGGNGSRENLAACRIQQASRAKSSCSAAAVLSTAPPGSPAQSLVVTHTPEELQAAIDPNTAMIYTTILGRSGCSRRLRLPRTRKFRCCSTMRQVFRPSRTCVSMPKMGARSVLLQRRQRSGRPAVFRSPARTKGSDRRRDGQYQSLGRRGLPRHEGGQGRSNGLSRCGGGLEQDGSRTR